MSSRTPMESRDHADFRLLRDELGVSQKWVADRVGVTKQTVCIWEDPRAFARPSREAWDLLEGMWRRADSMAASHVDIARQAVEAAREDGRTPAMLILPYWRTQADYRKSGRTGSMEVENLATKMAHDRLAVLGLPCGIKYAEPVA